MEACGLLILLKYYTKIVHFFNPSSGLFNMTYRADIGETIQIEIYNAIGGLPERKQINGNGFTQKTILDLSKPAYPDGIYFVKVSGNTFKSIFRLAKIR